MLYVAFNLINVAQKVELVIFYIFLKILLDCHLMKIIYQKGNSQYRLEVGDGLNRRNVTRQDFLKDLTRKKKGKIVVVTDITRIERDHKNINIKTMNSLNK